MTVEWVKRNLFPLIIVAYGVFVLVTEWHLSSSRWAGFIAIGLGIVIAILGIIIRKKEKQEEDYGDKE